SDRQLGSRAPAHQMADLRLLLIENGFDIRLMTFKTEELMDQSPERISPSGLPYDQPSMLRLLQNTLGQRFPEAQILAEGMNNEIDLFPFSRCQIGSTVVQ